jgi:hypothetical protein
MSEVALGQNLSYKRDILDAYAGAEKKFKDALAKYEQAKTAAERGGQAFDQRRPGAPWRPTELYNGMIANLVPYAIKGAIWYQGESNAGRAHQYRTLFPDMITNWRRDWHKGNFGGGNFAFLAVQLAPYMAIKDQPAESAWAELREAQVLATKKLPDTGVVVITDVGDEKDIHPRKKSRWVRAWRWRRAASLMARTSSIPARCIAGSSFGAIRPSSAFITLAAGWKRARII